MHLPPAVIVHGLADARAALEQGQPVTLLSAPGAAVYAGVGWWRALVRAAGATVDILDCGEAPGRALEALRGGQGMLVLRVPAPLFADIADRAARGGATLFAAPPLALDLATRGAARRLAAWLAAGR